MLQKRGGKRMGVLDGKALVTGASKGIGAGIAKGLAAAGASVVVNYAPSKEGAGLCRRLQNEEARPSAHGDVSKSGDVKQLFEDVVREFGGLDVLVNNAGVYSFGPLESVTQAEFHRQYNTNVLGTLLATQEAVKLFGEKGGSIINIGTAGTRNPGPAMVLYLSTKGAIDIITQVLTKELEPN
jgi:3-oxoacyl-[acyl-carrier protein] reductase